MSQEQEELIKYWEKWVLVKDLIKQLQYEHEKAGDLSRLNEVAWQIVNATREE